MISMIGILIKVTSGFLTSSVTDYNVYEIDCILYELLCLILDFVTILVEVF